jgi:hypothetical protein
MAAPPLSAENRQFLSSPGRERPRERCPQLDDGLLLLGQDLTHHAVAGPELSHVPHLTVVPQCTPLPALGTFGATFGDPCTLGLTGFRNGCLLLFGEFQSGLACGVLLAKSLALLLCTAPSAGLVGTSLAPMPGQGRATVLTGSLRALAAPALLQILDELLRALLLFGRQDSPHLGDDLPLQLGSLLAQLIAIDFRVAVLLGQVAHLRPILLVELPQLDPLLIGQTLELAEDPLHRHTML